MTNQSTDLRDYHAAQAISLRLMNETQNQSGWHTLLKAINHLYEEQNQILELIKQGKRSQAQQRIKSPIYSELLQTIKKSEQDYYQHYGIISDENSLVNVRLAAENMTIELQNIITIKMIILVIAVILSLLLAIISARNISRPINLLRDNMERLSSKKITIQMDPHLILITGEVGDLARAFFKLMNQLQTTTVLRDELELEVIQRKETEEKLRQSAKSVLKLNQQ